MSDLETARTLPKLENVDFTSPVKVRPSLGKLLKAAIAKTVSVVLPGVPIPGYCASCWTRLELVREVPTDDHEPYLFQGIRFWRCPDCGHGASTRYIHPGRTDLDDPNLY